MQFNSFEFIIFLPIVYCLYWFVFKSIKQQNILIVIASYIFYGWWNWHFLFLISFTSICSYISGIGINYYKSKNLYFKSKFICLTNTFINLLVLGIYKYYNFFAESIEFAFQSIGISLHPVTLNLILPVGISFYTFQALSYTIDVYRGKINATKDLVSFFAFISFFPQLVAGPIERATNLLPQFQKNRNFNYSYSVEGCRQILWGFLKKIIIADNCAYYADIAFKNIDECGSTSLILGAIFFTFQIYGDFSGYSSIAIGVAKLFGISLCANFKVPYFSRDIAEFWRRWHISLNKWFVDYIYIPLGGSRTSKYKLIRNIFVIFLLSGLWHGANWTYICWGIYHAILFLPLILCGVNKKHIGDLSLKIIPSFSDIFGMFLTFFLVVFGWIIFRSNSICSLLKYIKGIVSLRPNGDYFVSVTDSLWLILTIIFMLVVEWINRNANFDLQIVPKNNVIRHIFYLLIICVCYLGFMVSVEDDNTFIYFQF